jgi:hypothetical protein
MEVRLVKEYKKWKKNEQRFCQQDFAIILYLHIKSFSSRDDEAIGSIICLHSEEARRHNRQCR